MGKVYTLQNRWGISEKRNYMQWGGDGSVLNWAIGIDMYTLMCIKLMTNKNLQYKKTNKTKTTNTKLSLGYLYVNINVSDIT